VKELLPEYYLSSSSYSEADMDTMLALVRGRQGVGFAVRAGQVVVQACVSKLAKLIDTVQGGFVFGVFFMGNPFLYSFYNYVRNHIVLSMIVVFKTWS
jgi:precorrin-2 methylase